MVQQLFAAQLNSCVELCILLLYTAILATVHHANQPGFQPDEGLGLLTVAGGKWRNAIEQLVYQHTHSPAQSGNNMYASEVTM